MIIAELIVYGCDNSESCDAVFIVKDAETWQKFQDEWYMGIVNNYCSKCRHLPEVLAIIEQQEKVTKTAINSFQKELNAEEIQNADLIS